MFTASVWDRLIASSGASDNKPNFDCPALEMAKRAITRDLEALLNTRVALPDEELASYPYCRNSIVNFGLTDFAQRCLTSSEDRNDICARLMNAIDRHESRLSKIQVRLVRKAGAVNRLDFVIFGQLRTAGEVERIQFDAVLERSKLQYLVL